ncbi:MAG: cytochrome-c peroxidase [Cytophagaceae bacterium]|nr:cytochrome-c peroxidase [Cytophagaceae bacterium]|tara:strand:- start:2629 stop:4596 length:1968 start_codon:yes stop_codon:yes gene_type:complete
MKNFLQHSIPSGFKLFAAIGGLLVFMLLYGFSKSDAAYSTSVKATINHQLRTVSHTLDSLQVVAVQYREGMVTEALLRKQLTATRNAYKQVEGYATYYYPEHAKAYINGPPIPHLDPYPVGEADANELAVYLNSQPLDDLDGGYFMDGGVHVLAPVGLQRLDELVYAQEVGECRDEVVQLVEALQVKFAVLEEALRSRKYYHGYEVIEFCRLELVRIMSLGITGFDTPGSLDAMQESRYALTGVEAVLKTLIAKGSPERQREINRLFKEAKAFLTANPDFASFDRFTFIKNYINPLYKSLLQLQQELGIQSTAVLRRETPSWNAYSDNIFGSDFLNPYYYTALTKQKDGEALRVLGKSLFFDTTLSNNENLSCASCHQPERAYTDGTMKSLASVPGHTVHRNAPTLVNAIFADRFFYDLRSLSLDDQLGHVIQDHLEYDTSYEEIVHKLNTGKTYKQAFKNVFKTDTITRYQFSSALMSFLVSLRSFNSPFDQYIRGEAPGTSTDVKKGFNLFMGKANCATCHYAPTFSGLVPPLFRENETEVLGVLATPNSGMVDVDDGRFNNGVHNEDKAIFEKSFKTMTVRNAALTAPYFHNGAYASLEDVLELYNQGGAAGMGLAAQVPQQTLPAGKLNLSPKEMQQILAFIESLTDVPKI